MTVRKLSVVLVAIGLVTGCASSPSAPTNVSVTATQTAVLSTIGQAVSQSAPIAATPSGQLSFTYPCPAGGSITSTFNAASPPDPTGALSVNSRLTFNECRSGTVTLQGDPYLDNSGSYTSVQNSDGSADVSMTTHMTGGIRFDTNGVQGKAQYNCTNVMTMHYTIGSTSIPAFTMAASGSITWEQPLGSTPVTRSCGVSTP